MQFDSYCTQCVLNRTCQEAHKSLSPEEAHTYLLDAMNEIAHAPKGVAAPYLVMRLREIAANYGVTGDPYAKIKKDSNDYILAMLPRIKGRTEDSSDPLKTAMLYAQAGNFLDFGVLTPEDVTEKIGQAIENAPHSPLDEAEYKNFVQDLENARNLLIIGDNAGEIVFDTVLVEQLKKQYPGLSITYAVRGGNCLNDATREDAAYVGMDRLVRVIDNGTAISGTELDYIGPEMRNALRTADVILAKGQGNFETMVTCGYNVYYSFLCKCDRLCRILKVPMFTGMFLAEKRMNPITPFPD